MDNTSSTSSQNTEDQHMDMDSRSSTDILSTDATEVYSQGSGPSSQGTESYYQEAKWGPIRLYREARLDDDSACLQWCMLKQLIADQQECRIHRRPRSLRDADSRRPFWYCGRCNDRKSVLAGSVFEDSQLPLPKMLMLAYCFANECTYEDAQRNTIFHADEAVVSHMAIAHWYGVFRQVVGDHCIQQQALGSEIGGPGHIVQVDETMIGKRKYNRGRLVEGTWVFGMIDDEGDVRLQVVTSRDSDTLTGIILNNVHTGSIIHSDSWRGYSSEVLQWEGYHHFKVNHKQEYVASDGTHTQKIESQWRAMKRHFSPGGIRKEDIPDHLLEYAWRRNCKICKIEPFNDLLKLARV